MTADPNRLGFRVGPQPLRLPSDERGEIPSCDAGCMSYSDGWNHYHTCKFAAWYIERERAVAEVERLKSASTAHKATSLPERIVEIEKHFGKFGEVAECLCIIRGLIAERQVLSAMLRKVSDYLESANEIIEEDGGDEDDVQDARALIERARALLPPEDHTEDSADEQQPAPIPVGEIRRLADLAAQRDEFRKTDEAKLAVVETWLAGFPQETPWTSST